MSEYYIKETGEVLLDVRLIKNKGMVALSGGSAVRADIGDYLVTYPDGSQRITSAGAFEILYVR